MNILRKLIFILLPIIPLCAEALPNEHNEDRIIQLSKLQLFTPVFNETQESFEKGKQRFINVNVPKALPFSSDIKYWECRYGYLYDSMPDKAKWVYGIEAMLKGGYPDLLESDINSFLASEVDGLGLILAQAAAEIFRANRNVGKVCGEPILPDGWRMSANGEVVLGGKTGEH